ncbi:MAG: hypothetical protein U5N56_10310 [Candidatus Marinimicrobia bacterium]|nr:hypothetical protein [Candidatus Neomarinimicrobiota bacterium]
MQVILQFLILLAGILLLYVGANFLVRGSANLGRILGIKPIVIGLTVVAFGTSMPEFMVSMFGVLEGVSDISVGNIIGSNIANIGLILGISGLIAPIALKYHNIRKQLLLLFLGSLLFSLLAYDGLSRYEGFLFLLLLGVYIIYLAKSTREKNLPVNFPKRTTRYYGIYCSRPEGSQHWSLHQKALLKVHRISLSISGSRNSLSE